MQTTRITRTARQNGRARLSPPSPSPSLPPALLAAPGKRLRARSSLSCRGTQSYRFNTTTQGSQNKVRQKQRATAAAALGRTGIDRLGCRGAGRGRTRRAIYIYICVCDAALARSCIARRAGTALETLIGVSDGNFGEDAVTDLVSMIAEAAPVKYNTIMAGNIVPV